jgi:hypothetical protein
MVGERTQQLKLALLRIERSYEDTLSTLRKALSRMLPDDRKLLLEVTQRLARRKRKRSNPTQVTVEIKDRTS